MIAKFRSSVETISSFDPSEKFRPEPIYSDKLKSEFRDYSKDSNDPIKERIRLTYLNMHTNQTVDFVRSKMKSWLQFNKCKMNIKEALIKLNELVDESDPDSSLPNIVHAFQTAEKIRIDHPNEDWFHLTGLIHDLGKVMALYGEPQWAVVGDTFPVGCDWANSIVYRDTSFINNPDGEDPRYNTKFGMYKPKCGLENLLMSWGHDEYLYQVLKHNKSTLPNCALAIVRYHSFYPWHAGGDYMYFCTKDDIDMLDYILMFNKYDLYTKNDEVPDIDKLWAYYEQLIEKYIPGVLEW
ncbi:PREDICTED: inositol oxygenase [Ceratosolen solmsi marchali]|uniref:Inositol oxygenase n=1 Tax=Ceratosolen solmsi marchali TaxID=326594 RepID=A0AAJ6YHP2_9HYME|nr:PREDICTED: inositol oxygenase [Ceratosolen solmsi marchali]